MKAVIFDKELRYVEDFPKPNPKPGEALVKVTLAGICNTDYEITKGYMGYVGILGHECVGIVEAVNGEDSSLAGRRVAPEISYGCKKIDCPWCAQKLYRHCPERHTLGIVQKDGCFAEYFTMPVEVLFEVPDGVPDEQAVFVEPLAAGMEIAEQLHIKPYERVIVLGDGKLGIVTAMALNALNINVTLVGKHQKKLYIAYMQGVQTKLLHELAISSEWDVVVEATGSISGFETALSLVRPRGVLVLKSTVAGEKPMNLAPIVINEITVLGSRCGQFPAALRLLGSGAIDCKPLITAVYDVSDALKAFEKNKEKETLKVLLRF